MVYWLASLSRLSVLHVNTEFDPDQTPHTFERATYKLRLENHNKADAIKEQFCYVLFESEFILMHYIYRVKEANFGNNDLQKTIPTPEALKA